MILPPENRFVKGVTSKTDSNFAKKTAWLIETERKSFAEAPNTVLRRLLNRKAAPEVQHAVKGTADRGAWTGKGVKLPSGTEVRMEYRGKEHRGVIQDSDWVVDGKRFKALRRPRKA